jgi:aspartyl-tRNA(Asn)/glutamyl-tRNA(Gln) amidotransferase subunit C
MPSRSGNALARRRYHAYLCGKSKRPETAQFEAVAGGFPALLYAPQAGDFRRSGKPKRRLMSVDAATVRRIAHLARVAVADDEVEHLRGEINAILSFVEQLSEVDVEGVEPMTSVTPMVMKKRHDVVTDGNDADAVLRNAPATEHNYFLVPKVVE